MVGITSKPKTDKLPEIQLLRVICILGVVSFHIYQMTYDGNHLPEEARTFNQQYYKPIFSYWVINLAMPMFMLLSGYLFYYLLGKGKYVTWSNMLKKKITRLIIPYFAFALLMVATTGANFDIIKILHGGFGVYWFLTALMWCFILGYAIKDTITKPRLAVTILFLGIILSQCPRLLPRILGMHNLSPWFGWFYMGGILCHYKEKIISFITLYRLQYVLLLITVIVGALWPTEYGDESVALAIYEFCGILVLWYWTARANLDWMSKAPIIEFLAANSFGLYVFHFWIGGYLIGNTSRRIFGIDQLSIDHPIIYPFVFFLTTLLISLVLSMVIRKTKVGSFLLG